MICVNLFTSLSEIAPDALSMTPIARYIADGITAFTQIIKFCNTNDIVSALFSVLNPNSSADFFDHQYH